MEADLRTTLAGVVVRNPVGVGAIGLSAYPGVTRPTPERHAEILLKQVEAGAGCLYVPFRYASAQVMEELEKKAKKAVRYGKDYTSAPPLFLRGAKGPDWDNFYLVSTASTSSPRTYIGVFERYGARLISLLREKKPQDVPLIGSVRGFGAFPETFASAAKAAQDAGVEMVEINVSCSLEAGVTGGVEDYFNKDFPLRMSGCLVGDQPELVEAIIAEVTKTVTIPVGVKLSPETGFPRIVEVAQRAKKAGARFINCSNNAVTVLPPDIYRRGKPKAPFTDTIPFVAGQGNFIRPIVYKQVAAIARFVPGIDIIATGGLMTPVHLVEAMMLGARLTHFATAYLLNGPKFITRCVNFLQRFLAQEGYASVADIVGLGLEYIKPTEEVQLDAGGRVASLDSSKCVKCGLCTAHGLCFALSTEDKAVKLNAAECWGCGMCVAICPKEAITLQKRPSKNG